MTTSVTNINQIDPASFGVFVGLYNKLNNTSFTVKDALSNRVILSLYSYTSQTLQANFEIQKKIGIVDAPIKNTRKASNEVMKRNSTVVKAVYELLEKSETPLSRFDVSEKLGIRMSTACSQIHRLIGAGMAKVVATKVDPNTHREVELVEIM